MNPTERNVPPLRFPFNSLEYAETYKGRFLFSKSILSAVSIQEIPGTRHFDGRLPWPYILLPDAGESLIRKEFPELVTMTGVVAPRGASPSSTAAPHELTVFKPHFIYDPSLGPIVLSAKSASNLRKGSRVWRVADPDSSEGWEAFADLSRRFVLDKKISGGFFDFGDEHYRRLSTIESMKLFGVRSSTSWGAMACGAQYGTEIHLMHICISSQGYRSYASYVLMDALIRHCEESRKTLFLGGVRQGGDEGVLRFKKRWTNKSLPAWLLKVVIRPDIYESLAILGNAYFPGYRLPPSPENLRPAENAPMGDGGS